MNYSLTVNDCTSTEAQLLIVVSEIVREEEEFISGDYESLGFFMDHLLSFYGGTLENFVTYLWSDPEDFSHVAEKMDQFSTMVQKAMALSKDERSEIRARVRARSLDEP